MAAEPVHNLLLVFALEIPDAEYPGIYQKYGATGDPGRGVNNGSGRLIPIYNVLYKAGVPETEAFPMIAAEVHPFIWKRNPRRADTLLLENLAHFDALRSQGYSIDWKTFDNETSLVPLCSRPQDIRDRLFSWLADHAEADLVSCLYAAVGEHSYPPNIGPGNLLKLLQTRLQERPGGNHWLARATICASFLDEVVAKDSTSARTFVGGAEDLVTTLIQSCPLPNVVLAALRRAQAETLPVRPEAGDQLVPNKEAFMNPGTPATNPKRHLSRRVFVVYGRDPAPRLAVELFLRELNLEPVILEDKPGQGMTIIEKIEANDDVGFAVVLLTPDDEGCLKGETPQARARQNVIFELGYFVAKLKRSNVAAIRSSGPIEVLSDYLGVSYLTYDSPKGTWRNGLFKELVAAGYDLNPGVLV